MSSWVSEQKGIFLWAVLKRVPNFIRDFDEYIVPCLHFISNKFYINHSSFSSNNFFLNPKINSNQCDSMTKNQNKQNTFCYEILCILDFCLNHFMTLYCRWRSVLHSGYNSYPISTFVLWFVELFYQWVQCNPVFNMLILA